MPNVSTAWAPTHDDKKGLGYGGLDVRRFHAQRPAQSSYPYKDPDAFEDDDDTLALSDLDAEEMDKFVRKVNLGYKPSDSFRARGNDPFYFTGAAHKMMEVDVTANSISPAPYLYKKRAGGAGSTRGAPRHPVGYRTLSRPTGTKRGWSSAPKEDPSVEDINPPEYTLKDVLEPDDPIADLRALVAAIHNEDENTRRM